MTWDGIDRRQSHMDEGMSKLRAMTFSLNERDSEIYRDLDRFKIIANNLALGVWYCRDDGSAVYVNKTWAEWAGMTMEDCLGSGWIEGLALEDRMRAWENWRKAVKDGISYKDVYRVVNHMTGATKKCFAMGNKIGDSWVGFTIDLDTIGEHFYATRGQ